MSAETNKVLVQRFVTEWLNARRSEALAEICALDFAFHWGPLGDGHRIEALVEREEQARNAFPDLQVKPVLTVADSTYVVNRSIVSGTHSDTWLGVPPTGVKAVWTAVEIYRVADGRLAEQWLNEDWTSVLQQFGVVPTAF